MQVAYDYRHLANRSAKCKSLSAVWRTSPRNARGFLPFGEHLLQSAGDLRTSTNHLLQSAGDLRTPTNHLLQLAGDLRTPTNHLLQLVGDYRTPTNISCNLRETFVPLHTISCNLRETIVPLQTSPAICGRPSYPYKHLLQLAGDYRTPTKKCFSFFFRLRFVLLIESPTFVSLKYNTQKR